MKIEVAAIDMDETLLGEDGKVSGSTSDVLQHWLRSGNSAHRKRWQVFAAKKSLTSYHSGNGVGRVAKLSVKLVRSSIGYDKTQKATVQALGLRKLNKTVVHNDTPQIRGMIYKIRHLVLVEEVES